MNCQPGDLAVIVRSTFGDSVGMLVQVHDIGVDGPAGWEWMTSTFHPMPCFNFHTKEPMGLDVTAFHPDAWLKPIRPQADDAECNSAAWLPPAPTKEYA